MISKKQFPTKMILYLLGLTLTIAGCTAGKQKSAEAISNFDQLKKLFIDPPPDYRSAPLWDWNDRITEEGIDFQMEKFKEGGLGGVFIHPRPGLLTEYISEDWHRMFDHTVKKGKELGLKVWIYDENSYPSGFAGGHVPAEMPESYNHGTGMSCEVQEILNPDTVRYEVILKKENNQFIDITSAVKEETGKKGVYYLFAKTYGQKAYWYGNFPYVDLLYNGVTQKFMDITMKGYEQYNKPDFGKSLMGIFTDEPNLEAAMGPNSVFRWTPDLFSEFNKRWGYDLKVNLPSLVDETGNWKKVRHDYYEVILQMFLDRWAKPWSKYCENNGLKWTGHYWEHGWPIPTEGIDESSFYIYHQQPGVDMLGNELIGGGDGGQFGNTRAVRELRSAANQGGHIRTLSETYGGAGWEINFSNMKRLVDWEEVLGVNFVNQHLSYFTIKGVRKFDYPPSFSYHEPWWKSYKSMGDYIGRVSLAMSSGEQINQVLVLQPNTTAWMFFSRRVKNGKIDSIKNDFKRFVYRLERNHYEYDLGSENVIRTIGSVKNGRLVVGERAYALVVIPASMANLDKTTFNLLKKFLAQGGKVLSFAEDIPYIDGTETTDVSELRKTYTGQWTLAGNTEDPGVKQYFKAADFSIAEPVPAQGELYFQRRMMDDGQVLFFVNSDTMAHAGATISATGKSLIRMDLVSGKVYQVPSKSENGTLVFDIDLPPVGSALYYVLNNLVNEPLENEAAKKEEPVAPLGTLMVRAEDENVLVMNYLDVKSRNIDLKDAYFMKAMHQLFDSNGFSMGNPWQHKIQYKQDYLALDTFHTGSGFEVNYHFVIAKSADLKSLEGLSAVVERPELWDVYLNGTKLLPSETWWIDRDFHRFPIGKSMTRGTNTLTLKAEKMSVFAELMPAYVVGNFILKPGKAGFEIADGKISEPGSWRSNGYPFYSQSVSYVQKFVVEKENAEFRVKLNRWNGTLAEVKVNGSMAGSILWLPYELNIGSLLKDGENVVEVRITGSLKNTFGYFFKSSKQWINGPGDWDTAPSASPSWDQYFLMDYGLFEPFSLVRLR
jgi:hypothetical protein